MFLYHWLYPDHSSTLNLTPTGDYCLLTASMSHWSQSPGIGAFKKRDRKSHPVFMRHKSRNSRFTKLYKAMHPWAYSQREDSSESYLSSLHRLQKHQKEMCGESLFCWDERKSTAGRFIHKQKAAAPASQWMCLHGRASRCETWWKLIFTSSPDESGEKEMCLDYMVHVWLYWKE